MFSTRPPIVGTPEIASVLAIITDELYAEGGNVDSSVAFAHLLSGEDEDGVVGTLYAGAAGLLDEFLKSAPDVAACEVSDGLAESIIGGVWGRWERVNMGKALLRSMLNDGETAALSAELRAAYAEPGAAKIVVLAVLVTGMSAALARGVAPNPGDPLRTVLGI